MVRGLAGCGGGMVSGNLMLRMGWVWSVIMTRCRGQRDVGRIAGNRVVDICGIHTRRKVDRGGGGGGLDRRGGGSGGGGGVGQGGVAIHGHRGRDHLCVGQRGGAVPVDGGRGGGVRHIHRDSFSLSCLGGWVVEAVAGVIRVEIGEAIEGGHTRGDAETQVGIGGAIEVSLSLVNIILRLKG